MLTRKQHELLMYIDGYLKESGFSPSFEEMKEALQLRSKSGVHRLIKALEERGVLRRRQNRARALEVVRLPETAASRPAKPDRPIERQSPPSGGRFAPNVIKGDFSGRPNAVRVANEAGAVQLPLYGKIAAGLAIEAMRDESVLIDVPAAMLGAGDHYALEVAGDSMIEAGILDGDTAIVRRCDRAENGQIVVALVDETEVTLKRLRRKGNSVALEPANPRYETRIVPADHVKVQGQLVGLLRRYN